MGPFSPVPCILKIRQEGLGSCPKCGMALEPKAIAEEEEKNPELIDMTRRFKASCHEFQLCFGGGQCAEAEKGKAMKESG